MGQQVPPDQLRLSKTFMCVPELSAGIGRCIEHASVPADDFSASFVVGLLTPGCQYQQISHDGDPYDAVMWLFDPTTGSRAAITVTPDGGQHAWLDSPQYRLPVLAC